MKKLMRVKLINWHRFTNTTIEFEKSTLISGENGAGKSTFLDAIQFVIICSTNYFNKAAPMKTASESLPVIFAAKQDGKTDLMNVPVRSAPISRWNSTKKKETSTL